MPQTRVHNSCTMKLSKRERFLYSQTLLSPLLLTWFSFNPSKDYLSMLGLRLNHVSKRGWCIRSHIRRYLDLPSNVTSPAGLVHTQIYVAANGLWLTSLTTGKNITQSNPIPDSKVHGANMGPIWGRQDPCGPHVATWTLLSGICL